MSYTEVNFIMSYIEFNLTHISVGPTNSCASD